MLSIYVPPLLFRPFSPLSHPILSHSDLLLSICTCQCSHLIAHVCTFLLFLLLSFFHFSIVVPFIQFIPSFSFSRSFLFIFFWTFNCSLFVFFVFHLFYYLSHVPFMYEK